MPYAYTASHSVLPRLQPFYKYKAEYLLVLTANRTVQSTRRSFNNVERVREKRYFPKTFLCIKIASLQMVSSDKRQSRSFGCVWTRSSVNYPLNTAQLENKSCPGMNGFNILHLSFCHFNSTLCPYQKEL